MPTSKTTTKRADRLTGKLRVYRGQGMATVIIGALPAVTRRRAPTSDHRKARKGTEASLEPLDDLRQASQMADRPDVEVYARIVAVQEYGVETSPNGALKILFH